MARAVTSTIKRIRVYADTRDMLEVTSYVHHLRNHNGLLLM
jgi:hypothetical protein